MSCRYSVNERLINLQHDIINTNSSGEGCISNEDKPNSNSNSKSTKAFWLVMCAQLTGHTAQYETNIPHTHTHHSMEQQKQEHKLKQVKVQGTATGALWWLVAGLRRRPTLNLLTCRAMLHTWVCYDLQLHFLLLYVSVCVCVFVRNIVRPCLPFAQRLTAHANSNSNNNIQRWK